MDSVISVIIPIYNKAKYLKDCLNSVLKKEYNNIEIICVDDGSTDNSIKILKLFQKRFSNLSVYCLEHRGVSVARNFGLKKATGRYVHFVDADDIVVFDMYTIILKDLINNLDFDLLTSSSASFKDSTSCTTIKKNIISNKFTISNYYDNPDLYFENTEANLRNKIFKLDIIRHNNLFFDEQMCFGEDAEFYYRFLFYCKTIVSFKDSFYLYRLVNEFSYTSQLLNKPGVFSNDLKIFTNLIMLFNSKPKNICLKFAEGAFKIIFDAYLFISNVPARIKANIDFNNFINKNIKIIESLNLFEKFSVEFSMLEFDKNNLSSDCNLILKYSLKINQASKIIKEMEKELFNKNRFIVQKETEIERLKQNYTDIINSKTFKLSQNLYKPLLFFKKMLNRKN